MKTARRCKVEVRKDHLSKLASGAPKTAIAELIWNALDADATNVTVTFPESAFGGAEEVIVDDDGQGMLYSQAESFFQSLGGSWKASKQRTESGRYLHGKEGEGRFKAFALGRVVEWRIRYKEAEEIYEYSIEGRAETMDEFAIGERAQSKSRKTGVTVRVGELAKALRPETQFEQLAPIFAPYLSNYRGVTLRINGDNLDPDALIRYKHTTQLTPSTYNGKSYPAELEIIEWHTPTDKEIWFCDSRGFPLEQLHRQVRGAGDHNFTAYLKSEHLRLLHNDGFLSLGENEPTIASLCEEAIRNIREYFIARSLEEAKEQLDEWKREAIYPYDGEPQTLLEDTERKVFDIVAINVNQQLNLQTYDKKARKFQLRMLRHAIEKNPEELQTIMSEVLGLPKQKREQLATLLQETTLSSIISASSIVADRIKFIAGLEEVIFNHDHHLKERSQLHRLLAKNPWVFGETFSLSVDDKSLTEVLRAHTNAHKIVAPINSPVKRIDGRVGIVDLMLSRQTQRRPDELEHLVVELKAPKVVINKEHYDQIESYAFAVAADPRFRNLKTKWEFWIISTDYDQYIDLKLGDDRYGDGAIFKTSKGIDLTIYVKTWSQVVSENKHRLQFIREKLDYNIDNEKGVEYLKTAYAEYMEGIEVTMPTPETA